MTKTRNIPPQSFTEVKFFPGTTGNPFDLALHSMNWLVKMSFIPFALILALIAFLSDIPVLFAPVHPLLRGPFLFLFFLADWGLIALLPKTGRSYGPVKPVVLALALLRLPFMFLPYGWNLGFEALGTCLVIYGFYLEPFRLDIHREVFSSPKLPADFYLCVTHLGDLHIERNTRREKQVLRTLEQIKPDLVLFSGDILNLSYLEDDKAQTEAREFLSGLHAPLGVYGVSGSPAVDLPDLFPRLVKETPVQWLSEQSVHIGPSKNIAVYGLDCSHDPDKDEKVLQKVLADSPMEASTVNILLHHSPDFAPNASQYGFDLMLSGHTHGGQVCLPGYGALFCGSLYKKGFEAGKYLVNGMTLYVTRGLGMEGAIAPRVRFLCPPEMIIWEFRGEQK